MKLTIISPSVSGDYVFGNFFARKHLMSAIQLLVNALPVRMQLELRRLREVFRQRIRNKLIARYQYSRYLGVQIHSSAYTRQHPVAQRGAEANVRVLLRHVTPGAIVLDAGCGDGFALDLISVKHIGIGIDVNYNKLQDARRHGHQRVFRGDLHRLPLPDTSVDAVFCSHVLEHMLDARTVLRELHRVLRPGGTALFVVPLGPANWKHPTAFITVQDAIRLIGRFMQILHDEVGHSRGAPEVRVLATKGALD